MTKPKTCDHPESPRITSQDKNLAQRLSSARQARRNGYTVLALQHLDASLDALPGPPHSMQVAEIEIERMEILLQLEDAGGAESAARRALTRLPPGDSRRLDAWMGLAASQVFTHQSTAALASLKAAAAQDRPPRGDGRLLGQRLYLEGRAHLDLGRLESARNLLIAASQIQEKRSLLQWMTYFELARLSVRQGFSGAVEALVDTLFEARAHPFGNPALRRAAARLLGREPPEKFSRQDFREWLEAEARRESHDP